MNKPTVSWKISRPTVPDALPRERLFEKLDQARSSPAIWISGPAGSGKTTLVSSYVDSRKLPCIWYEIDETDDDLAGFFYHLRLAANDVIDEKDLLLPELGPEQMASFLSFTSQFFFQLTSALPSPFLLVFDDYQNVLDEAVLRQVFIQAAGKIPPGVNILIISRKEPTSPYSKLLAKRELATIGWIDLKLDLEEFRQILKSHVKSRITLKAINNLHQRLEGWVSGLLLLTEYLRLEDADPEVVLSSLPREYFDYFANEIFGKLDPEIRELLLKASVLEVFSPEMADQLAGINKSEAILEHLHSNNLFVERISRSPLYYRFHHLFGEFLSTQASRAFSKKAMKGITANAAMILLEHGYVEESVTLLKDSETWKALAEVIVKMAPELIDQGRHHTLGSWLDLVPEKMLEKDPDLLYWMGRNLMPTDAAGSRTAHKRAMELFQDVENWSGMCKTWSGQIATYVLNQRDLEGLDELIELFDKFKEAVPTPDDPFSQERVATSMFFALVLRRPNHPDINTWRDRALELTERSESVNLRVWALYSWSLLGRFRGDLIEFRSAIDVIRHTVKQEGARNFNRIMCCAFSAIDYFYRYKPDACLEEVKEGLRLADESAVHGWDPLLIGQRINVHLCEEDLDAARNGLDEMGEYLGIDSPNDRSYYHSRYAWYAILKGDFPLALHNAEIGSRLSEQGGFPENYAQNQLLLGSAALGMGKIELVEEAFRSAMQFGSEFGNKLIVFLSLLLRARLCYHREDNALGDNFLRKAFALGAEQGYINWHFWQADVMSDLCSRALQVDIEREYTLRLIQKRGIVPSQGTSGSRNWPWPLRIFTLGRFEVMVNDDPIKFNRKRQQKPLDMLKAILSLGGREVSEDQIVDILWPDASGDLSHQNFTITLHRLRKLLGIKDAIRLSGGQVSVNPDLCWVDCRAVEARLEKMDILLKGDRGGEPVSEAIMEADRVLELYKGNFLSQDAQLGWKISMQERIRSKYLQTMEKLGSTLENLGMWSEAAGIYRKVLEVDDLAESTYRKLMMCYQEMGLRAEAISVCRRCVETLSSTLGIEISLETQSLCDKIKQM